MDMQSIKAKAFSLLARRAYFSKQLEAKLKEKGYLDDEIQALFRELEESGWLNDLELASRFVERQKEKGYGPRVISMKLREKAGAIDIPIEESEEAVIAFVKKRYLRDLPEKRQKVIGALLRRGISYDLINKVLAYITQEKE